MTTIFSYFSFLFEFSISMASFNSDNCWKNPVKWEDNEVGAKIASDYLVKILTSNVYDAAIETPLTFAPNISAVLKNEIYLKREDTQPVFSFKIRGAINKIASLTQEQLTNGVVTCSAGNHAQGVALSANKLKIQTTIVMPEATPQIKVNAVRRFGGEYGKVVLKGKNYDEAAAEAIRLVKEQGFTMVHPFDDPMVIAGQGTIGMEIIKDLRGKKLDAIFACIGGGGLASGIAAYVKAVRPDIKVIGVEAADAAGMTESLKAGKVVTLPHVGLFADGAAVRTIGTETFGVCQALVDEMITVKTDEICSAIKLCFNDTRSILEPAGALAIAGMVKYCRQNGLSGKTFVAVASGANMDFDRLRFVSERADMSETLMSITIPEKPGSFRALYSLIYPRNVTEFSYRHNGTDRANVIASFQALSGSLVETDKVAIMNLLQDNGYAVEDLSENELAKVHARHLAGGRAINQWEDGVTELVYRFEFPEAPGALEKFLHTLYHFNQGWSVSLFHYRNHGDDYGRVLVGLLVKDIERGAFASFLEKLDYKFYDETNNSAFLQFMK